MSLSAKRSIRNGDFKGIGLLGNKFRPNLFSRLSKRCFWSLVLLFPWGTIAFGDVSKSHANEQPLPEQPSSVSKPEQPSTEDSAAKRASFASRFTPRFSLSAAAKSLGLNSAPTNSPAANSPTLIGTENRETTPLESSAETDSSGLESQSVYLRIPQATLAKMVAPRYTTRSQINDSILGTPITGTTQASATLNLQPSEHDSSAELVVRINGVANSRTTGFEGRIQILGRAVTRFDCQTVLRFGSAQQSETEPGFALRQLRVQGQSVSYVDEVRTPRNGPGGRLVQRAAWRQIERRKPQTDAIAHQKTMQQLEIEIRKSLQQELASLNQNLAIASALACRLNPDGSDHYATRTTSDHLYFCFGESARDDFAAATKSTAESAKSNRIEILVHRRLMQQQFAASLLLGRQVGYLSSSSESNRTRALTEFVEELNLPVKGVQFQGDWMVIQLEPERGLETLMKVGAKEN